MSGTYNTFVYRNKLTAGNKFPGLSIKLIGSVYETTDTVKQALHVHNIKDHGTLTGKIGNVHCLWFSSVAAKTFDVTVQLVETNLLRTSLKTQDWKSYFKVNFQSTCFMEWTENIYTGWTFKIRFKIRFKGDTIHYI